MAVKNQYHKQKLREKEFKEKIFESLKAQYSRGLLNGTRAMLKVIGDMIAENGLTPEEKLAKVMKFINTSLAMTDKTVEEADAKAKETEAAFDSLGEDDEPVEDAPANEDNIVKFPATEKANNEDDDE